MKNNVILMFSLSLLTLFTYCKKQETISEPITDNSSKIMSAEEYMPADPKLAEKYKRSCFMCHSNTDAGAPLTKDKIAWQERIDQRGLDGLLKSTLEGYNAMPAKGQCIDCTEAELNELIKFMADVQ
jgi:cytochrome c5